MIKEITVRLSRIGFRSGVLAVWLKKDGEYVNEGEGTVRTRDRQSEPLEVRRPVPGAST